MHERKERLTESMKNLMMMSKPTHRDQINCNYTIKSLLDSSVEVNETILELGNDKDGLRKEELEMLSGPNEIGTFYKQLKEIKEFHRKHPDEIFIPMSVEFDKLEKDLEPSQEEPLNLVDFTDEEGYGRFLDMHEAHSVYINLKGAEQISYVRYLESFHKLSEYPRKMKSAKQYKEYLDLLLNYLTTFTEKVQPLHDLYEEFKKCDSTFKEKWEKGTFPGWGKETGSAMTRTGAVLDLSMFSSVDELASLGLDRLKSALMAINLKCGGTLEQRAERLFSTKGKSPDEIDSSLYAKGKGKKIKKVTNTEDSEEIAALEARIYCLSDLLEKQRLETKENVQRRQARNESERDDDGEDAASDSDSEDDDNEIIYNPKNLPLGWDGKPIPYWLYKLHGLNINYKCEICGNQTYRGPKAFQRHFSEWRHAHGMRCLGIPNTAHFANVTRIEDALQLWNKIKQAKDAERWNPDHEEEFEDSAGNVVSKRTYDDLQRQGLL